MLSIYYREASYMKHIFIYLFPGDKEGHIFFINFNISAIQAYVLYAVSMRNFRWMDEYLLVFIA